MCRCRERFSWHHPHQTGTTKSANQGQPVQAGQGQTGPSATAGLFPESLQLSR